MTSGHIISQNIQSLPSPINNQSSNESMPSMSANGRMILFAAPLGDYNELKYCISSQKNGVWAVPEPIPQINTDNKKLFSKGHFLSYDGSQIYFSSAKFGGVGNSDIWYSTKQGNIWSNPTNLGKPINDVGNETDPSTSADGRYLFFTRTDSKKTAGGSPCGKIYMSEKINSNTWSTPKMLPSPINIGCECNARLLPDQRTLTFASQREGGKGAYDQYMTQWLNDGSWSKPLPIPINTVNDDLYISIPAGGDYVYYSATINKDLDIVRSILPVELKPAKSLLLTASIALPQNINNAKGSTVIYKNLKSYLVYPNHKGNFFIALNQFDDVEIIYQSDYKRYWPTVKRYKLDTLTKYGESIENIILQPMINNSVYHFSKYPLDNISANSKNEIAIITRIIKENPNAKFTLEYLIPNLDNLKVDSSSMNMVDTNDKIESAKKDAESLKNKLVANQISETLISIKPIQEPYVNTSNFERSELDISKLIYLKIIK